MADDPVTDIALVAIAVGATLALLLEVRMKRLRAVPREHRRDDLLPDQAHNDLLTTEAIAASLVRRGIRSPQAEALIEEGRGQVDRNHPREALATLERAREALALAQKSRAKDGEVAKLEALASAPEGPSSKPWQASAAEAEALRARFAVGKASRVLGEKGGPPEAAALVRGASDALGKDDYKGAMAKAQKALRAMGQGEGVELSPRLDATPVNPCPACGAPLARGEACALCGYAPEDQAA